MAAGSTVARHESMQAAKMGQPFALGLAQALELLRPRQATIDRAQDEGDAQAVQPRRQQARHGRADRGDPMHEVEPMRPEIVLEVAPDGRLERVVERQGQRHEGRPALLLAAAQPAREAQDRRLEPVEIDGGEVDTLAQARGQDGLAVGLAGDEVHLMVLSDRPAQRPADPGHALRLRMGGFGKRQDTPPRHRRPPPGRAP